MVQFGLVCIGLLAVAVVDGSRHTRNAGTTLTAERACSGTKGTDYCCPWPGSETECAEEKCNQIQKIDTGLWTVIVTLKERPAVFFGQMYQRMAILLLDADVGNHSSKSLVLVNGAALDASLTEELRSLEESEGAKIRYVISSGDMHHVWLGDYNVAFPEATVYVPPGRVAGMRTKDLNFTVMDMDSPLAELRPQFHAVNFNGLSQPWDVSLPQRNELVFYHKSTKTLVTGDLFFIYSCEWEAAESRHTPVGTGAGTVSVWYEKRRIPQGRAGLWGDSDEQKAAAKKSARAVLELDFKRLVPIHGVLGNIVPPDASPSAKVLIGNALKSPQGIL